MTSRAEGRHRRRPSAPRPQSLLLLEYPGDDGPPRVYLNSGMVPNGSHPSSLGIASGGTGLQIGTGQQIGTGRGIRTGQARGQRAIRAALLRDRRAFAIALSAGLAGVAAAAVFGSFAPLHSTGVTGGRAWRGWRSPAAGLGAVVGRPAGKPVRAGYPGRPVRSGHCAASAAPHRRGGDLNALPRPGLRASHPSDRRHRPGSQHHDTSQHRDKNQNRLPLRVS